MLTSPALLSMVSSRSASTRAISTRSAGAVSRPGNTGALLSSRLEIESSLAATEAGCEAEGERRASTDCAKSAAATVAAAGTGARGAGTRVTGGAEGGGAAIGTAAIDAAAIGHRGRNGRCGRGRSSGRVRQIADLRYQRRRTRRQSAVADQIAHARECVEAGLHDRVGMIVADHGAPVDVEHQGLEFMAQIAHGGDAGHSGTTFEGMQLTLQFRDSVLVLAVEIPGGQRAFSRLQQFGRLFAVDVGDFVIKLLRRRRCRSLLGYCRECADHGRRAGVDGIAGDRGVEFGFDVMQPREQRRLFRKKCRRFVDVRYHVVDRADRVRQESQAPDPTIRDRCRRPCA